MDQSSPLCRDRHGSRPAGHGYLAKAAEAVAKDPTDLRATIVRYPEKGWPVRITMRGQSRDAGARPRVITVFLDPPTAAVLDVMEFRSSFFGFLHVFHENLTIPEYSGRQIVGWVGAGMLIMSLTGLWLWWPRGGGFLRGLRWTRSARFTINLHHLIGFWISIPLAVVSFTGIYLAFPQTARNAMSTVAPMGPPRGGFGGQIAQHTTLDRGPRCRNCAQVCAQCGAHCAFSFPCSSAVKQD